MVFPYRKIREIPVTKREIGFDMYGTSFLDITVGTTGSFMIVNKDVD